MARTLLRKDPLQSLSKTRRRVGTVERKVSRKGVIPYLGSVSAGSLQANSVTVSALAAGSVTTTALAANSVTAYAISAGSVTAYGIAANTIVAANIAAGTITATQIAASTITAAQIAAGSITADRIQAGSITATQIHAGTITATEIAAGTITATSIAAGSITATLMAADSISTASLQAGAVTASKITAGTITANEIAASTITAGNIAAGTITATQIAASTITASNIAAGTITATNIAAGTITSSLLAANAVTSTAIASGAVTAVKINVSQLSAVAADMGTITAGTLTGATVQTATSGARLVMNTGGLTAYNAANVAQLNFDTATGNLTLSGTVTANSSSVVPTTVLTGTLTTGQIGTGNVTSTNILNGTVAGIDIAANTITASNIVASTITATELAAGSITAADMLANTITAGQIASGTITATQIQAGSITADRMNVTALSAIVADLGTITAGTVTGATFQTATSGARVVLDSTGLRYYDATPTETVRLSSSTSGLQILASTNYLTPTTQRSLSFSSAIAGGTTTVNISGFYDTTSFAGNTYLGMMMRVAPATAYDHSAYMFMSKNSTTGQSDSTWFAGNTAGTKQAYVQLTAGTTGKVTIAADELNVSSAGVTVGASLTAGAAGTIKTTSDITAAGLVYSTNQSFSGTAGSAGLANDRIVFTTSQFYVLVSSSGIGVKLTNGSTAWVAQSDKRLKDVLGTVGQGVKKLKTLTPVYYRWKSHHHPERRVGLIAQEVQAILPEAVSEEPDGMLGVAYTDLIPLTIAAVKELDDDRLALATQVSAFGDLLRSFAGDVGDAIGGAKGKKLTARFAEWERLHSELAA